MHDVEPAVASPPHLRAYLTGWCEGITQLRDALAGHGAVELVGWGRNPSEAGSLLASDDLDVVLCAVSEAPMLAREVAAIRERTGAPVIALAGPSGSAVLEEALGAGVADVLLLPQSPEAVAFAIRKAARGDRREQPAAQPAQESRITTVFSPKGGTGKTAIATNLACAYAEDGGRRTLLVDLDLQFGDCAITLGIDPDKTIHDLVTAPGELDPDKLAGYITKHDSGLDLLAAPLRPEDAELVAVPKLVDILTTARETYDAIVVDTSPFFHGPMLATLDNSDELLLVSTLDVPTVKDVRLVLQTFELISFSPDRISLVLNRATADLGVRPAEVEAALDLRARHLLPEDTAVTLAVNRGRPVVLAEPTAPFAQAIRDLAGVAPSAQPAKSGRGFRFALGRA